MPTLSLSRGWLAGAAIVMCLVLGGCTATAATPTPPAAASQPNPPNPPNPTPSQPNPPNPPNPTPSQPNPPNPPGPASPTPGLAASPTSQAAGCTGSPDNQAFLVDAAVNLPFDVYCAVLPSGWWLQNGSYDLAAGGFLQIDYKTVGTAGFHLWEGAWCPPGMACIAHGPLAGPASFGGLAGQLYIYTEGTSPFYTIQVGTSANPAYLMGGSGMTQAQFTAFAAALIKVPKP